MTVRSRTIGMLFAVTAALTGGGGYYAWTEGRGGDATPRPVTAAAVSKVMALGEVIPRSDMVTIAAPTGQDVGRIADIKVAEGQVLQKGDVLAVFDTERSLSVLRTQAEANLNQRKAALAKLTADNSANERTLAAQLHQQQAQLDRANTDLANFERLKKSGTTTTANLLDKQLAVANAKSQIEMSRISLARSREANDAGTRIDLESGQADIAAAEAALAKAQSDYEKAFIRAPISGRILSLDTKIGEQVPNTGFAQIGDTSVMYVKAEVFETDLKTLAIGMPCTATSRVLSGKLSGTLERIGVQISRQSIVSTDPAAIVDARVVKVWIKLDAESSKTVADLSMLQVLVTFEQGAPHV